MTEAVVLDLAQYEALENKTVTLVFTDEKGEQVESEGKLQAVAPGKGIMFRRRGKQMADLVDEDKIISITPVAEAPKKVSAKKLKVVTIEDSRHHLADRHGYTLTQVNGATPEQALLAHQGIDHADLGHTHEDAESTEATVTE